MKQETICDSRCETNRCHDRQVVRLKWREIRVWPDTLVVHLVRWLPDFTKNAATVKFGMELQCSSVHYDLRAVVVHEGEGAGQGHYITFAVSSRTWLKCDDSYITIVDPSEVLRSESYLLVYQKRRR